MIQAQVSPDQSDPDFRKQVQSTLRAFVPGEWKIQNITRQKGNQFEGVHVRATVRVSEKEDYQLESRAAKVSKIGFELVGPKAEYELTFDEIQAVNAELRLELVKQALAECANYNKAFHDANYEDNYRISSTRFDAGNYMNMGNNLSANNRAYATTMIATSTASPLAGSASTMPTSHQYHAEVSDMEETEEGSPDMGVSTRFSMVGTFVLRSVQHV